MTITTRHIGPSCIEVSSWALPGFKDAFGSLVAFADTSLSVGKAAQRFDAALRAIRACGSTRRVKAEPRRTRDSFKIATPRCCEFNLARGSSRFRRYVRLRTSHLRPTLPPQRCSSDSREHVYKKRIAGTCRRTTNTRSVNGAL